ncbi:hypothetical protein V8B55DRAFT_1434112 [Mucor lusitanicus]
MPFDNDHASSYSTQPPPLSADDIVQQLLQRTLREVPSSSSPWLLRRNGKEEGLSRTYKQRVASSPIDQRPHPTLPSLSFRPLIRNVRDLSAPVGAERISKHMAVLLDKIHLSNRRGAKHKRLKARAVGSTHAVLNGAPVDAVVTHGSWFSISMFDNFIVSLRPLRLTSLLCCL